MSQIKTCVIRIAFLFVFTSSILRADNTDFSVLCDPFHIDTIKGFLENKNMDFLRVNIQNALRDKLGTGEIEVEAYSTKRWKKETAHLYIKTPHQNYVVSYSFDKNQKLLFVKTTRVGAMSASDFKRFNSHDNGQDLCGETSITQYAGHVRQGELAQERSDYENTRAGGGLFRNWRPVLKRFKFNDPDGMVEPSLPDYKITHVGVERELPRGNARFRLGPMWGSSEGQGREARDNNVGFGFSFGIGAE